MKARCLLVAMLALLLAAPTASAATYKFSLDLKREEFSDGKAGKVSFKVKTNKKGVATKVTSVKIIGLKSLCLSEDGVKPGPTLSGTVPGKFTIKKPEGAVKNYFFDKSSIKLNGYFFSIGGTLNKKGTKASNFRVDGSDGDPRPPSCTARGDAEGKGKKQ